MIIAGLKFKTRYSWSGEVLRIREALDQIDIVVINSDGLRFEQKDVSLEQFKHSFELGEYAEDKPEPNISFI
jgi:hypothetical protein